MAGPVATVLLPTTGDRHRLLAISAGSVLAQSGAALELFVIGDGVAPATRAYLEGLARREPRVRFFDHPKHVSRGERYRHAALAQARGRIVAYLTDRDIMLPDHLATLDRLLRDADFAHTQPASLRRDGRVVRVVRIDLARPEDRRRAARDCPLPLSTVGHTLAMYRRLPRGWRTTPPGRFTDRSMWQQFLAEPACRAVSCARSTILYLPRGRHPGWPDDRRLAELEAWVGRMRAPGWRAAYDDEVAAAVAAGRPLAELPVHRPARGVLGRRLVRRLAWLARRGP